MGFLTTEDLLVVNRAVAAWPRPKDCVLEAHLDYDADRLLVQLESRGVPMGTTFGQHRYTAVQVEFILDGLAARLRAAVAERLAGVPRPEPRWLRQAMEALSRWHDRYAEGVFQAAARLLRRLDVESLPPLEVKFLLRGVPLLVWRGGPGGLNSLEAEVAAGDGFRYTRRRGGVAVEAGEVAVDAAVQLADLLGWVAPDAPGAA